MKTLLLAFAVVLFSCGKQQPLIFEPAREDSIPPSDSVTHVTTSDTIRMVAIVLNDTLEFEYDSESYSGFERWFKEMATDKIIAPDKAYSKFMSLEDYKAININFDSEAGQDNFYMLYAYFLQQINGKNNYSPERQKLTAAYHQINNLKSYYQYGGTYFGHMKYRIYGYAEYNIYTLDKSLNAETDIAAGKASFISELKKIYAEKLNEDGDTMPHEKPEKLKRMMEMIDTIGNNISNAYTLKEVKHFYDDHYDYWM